MAKADILPARIGQNKTARCYYIRRFWTQALDSNNRITLLEIIEDRPITVLLLSPHKSQCKAGMTVIGGEKNSCCFG
jgi:hypothetical protein